MSKSNKNKGTILQFGEGEQHAQINFKGFNSKTVEKIIYLIEPYSFKERVRVCNELKTWKPKEVNIYLDSLEKSTT